MKRLNVVKTITFAAGFLAMAVACDEDRLTLADRQDIIEDAITDSYFEDADDLGAVSLSAASETNLNGAGARERDTITISVSDTRRCVGTNGIVVSLVRLENSTIDIPQGYIVIDFGEGCTDIRGNVRRGKLIYRYTGRRFQPNSSVVMTTDNYYINEVKLEGTRTVTNTSESTESAPRFTIQLEDGKAIFPDGREATREATFTREWVGRSTPADPNDDELRIEGEASGETRNGRSYTMNIEETIVFERSCEFRFPVSGVKIFVTDGKTITIDYGDGTCDRTVVYSVGDRTITTDLGDN